jgi:hypothetical protein
MLGNKNGKKLAFLGWHRSHFTQPASDYECPSCRLKGHCHTSEMCREVYLFGILIKQTRQIIECSRCSNGVVVGSMDLPMGKNSEAEPANFDLPNFSEDERLALRAVVGQKVQMHYSDVAEGSNARVAN